MRPQPRVSCARHDGLYRFRHIAVLLNTNKGPNHGQRTHDILDTPFCAGDSELLPPRFSGDARIDADDWADDMRIYVKIRNVSLANATLLL